MPTEEKPFEVSDLSAAPVDGARLLPGESPDSTDPEDIEHWIRVYQELLKMKADLVATLESAINGSGEEVRGEAAADRDLLTKQASHYQHRLAFWSARLEEAGN